MKDIKLELADFTASKAISRLRKRYRELLLCLSSGARVYIWGTGKLGIYAFAQCRKNGIQISGYIDNDSTKWDVKENVFSYEILKTNDIVILASVYYPQIIDQINSLCKVHYIYYEEFAYLIAGMETYYPAFQNIFADLEMHKAEYAELQDCFSDELSKEVYANIIYYKATLDIQYTKKALALSEQRGSRNFDMVIKERLNEDYSFYDVGGFDGDSALNYIQRTEKYNKIYLFEPDKDNMRYAKQRLRGYPGVVYVNAGVGEKQGYQNFNAIGGSSGFFSDNEMDGAEQVEIVSLDDYVKSHETYIKLDIEGYEVMALRGAKKIIESYHPMLSVSVYHKPDDLYRIIPLVLSWNPEYKVYLRHYTEAYTDTDVYFVM